MESKPKPSAAADPDQAGEQAPQPRMDEAESLRAHIDDLAEGIKVYVYSQIDLVKLAIRRSVILAGIFLVAVFGAASVFVTAVVLLCLGVSDVISELAGHRWVGEIATGVIVVGGGALAALIFIKTIESRSSRRTAEKYEAMKTANRQENGNGKQHQK